MVESAPDEISYPKFNCSSATMHRWSAFREVSILSVERVSACVLPTRWGEFQMIGFWDSANDKEHLALVMGELTPDAPILTRVHSECLTGDALSSLRCDCGAQLDFAMQKIAKEGVGVLLYLRQEGRGIGLLNKVKAYALQDQGAKLVIHGPAHGVVAKIRTKTERLIGLHCTGPGILQLVGFDLI